MSDSDALVLSAYVVPPEFRPDGHRFVRVNAENYIRVWPDGRVAVTFGLGHWGPQTVGHALALAGLVPPR